MRKVKRNAINFNWQQPLRSREQSRYVNRAQSPLTARAENVLSCLIRGKAGQPSQVTALTSSESSLSGLSSLLSRHKVDFHGEYELLNILRPCKMGCPREQTLRSSWPIMSAHACTLHTHSHSHRIHIAYHMVHFQHSHSRRESRPDTTGYTVIDANHVFARKLEKRQDEHGRGERKHPRIRRIHSSTHRRPGKKTRSYLGTAWSRAIRRHGP